MFADYHVHSHFSEDTDFPMELEIQKAIKLGMDELCFTEHSDYDVPTVVNCDYDAYFEEMEKMKDKYKGQITLKTGIEFGIQTHTTKAYEETFRQYPFDFVIGSVHLIHGQDPYYRGFFEGRSDEEAYHEAFQVTIENLKKIDSFDSLGHLDYVVRYGTHQAEEYSYRKYAEEIDEILKHLISHGKGLEMNMAGMKYGLGFPNPHPDVIRRYKELGGEIVTIGADAHRPEHVAFDYEQAREILTGCGFSYYAEFKGRKPVFRRIVP